jgi:hypothetical protein
MLDPSMTVTDTMTLPSADDLCDPDALTASGSQPSTASLYDPDVASSGLTLDTELGPVDLVAVERARAGRPVDLTAAEVAHLLETLPRSYAAARPVATALGVSAGTVLRRSRRALTGRKIA